MPIITKCKPYNTAIRPAIIRGKIEQQQKSMSNECTKWNTYAPLTGG